METYYLYFMNFWAFFFFCLGMFPVFGQSTARDSIADSLISVAKSQIGTPYKWATSEANVSFDCSGFTAYVYRQFNITECKSAKGYAQLGKEIPLENAQPGDCILFTGAKAGSKSVGHVGIVVSNTTNKLEFIHCSSSKKHFGVVLTDYQNSEYPKRFYSVRRLF